jgi:hypothetical protein
MTSKMESCQIAAITVMPAQRLEDNGASNTNLTNAKTYQATVDCPILRIKDQQPQTGEQMLTEIGAIAKLGYVMNLTSCNKCPISDMDLKESRRYLADIALHVIPKIINQR